MNGDKIKQPEELTLRDYFATAALQGMCTRIDTDFRNQLSEGLIGGKHYAQAAYVLADQMLKAREQ